MGRLPLPVTRRVLGSRSSFPSSVPPDIQPLTSVALMTDGDNTRNVRAYYGEVKLLAPAAR